MILALFLPTGLHSQEISAEVRQQSLLRVGNHVPPFVVNDLKGDSHDFQWASGGAKANIIFFFAPASRTSILEMNFLDQLVKKVGGNELRILAVEASGIEAGATEEAVRRYARLYSDPVYPVVADPSYRLSEIFGVRTVPSTFVVESHGVVLFQGEEFNDEIKKGLTKKVERILKITAGTLDGAPRTVKSATVAKSKMASAMEQMYLETDEGGDQGLQVGDQAPPLTLVDLEGKTHTLAWPADDGVVTVAFFWGALCLPCMLEMTYLEKIYQQAKGKGLRIFAIQASGLDAAYTKAVLKRYARFYSYPSYPIIPDPEFSFGTMFGIKMGGPATFFLNDQGSVIFWTDEFVQGGENRMTKRIELAMQMSSGVLRSDSTVGREVDIRIGDEVDEAPSIAEEVHHQEFMDNLAQGDKLFEDRWYEEALPFYHRCVELETKNVYVRKQLGRVYEKLKDYESALDHWSRALDLEPGSKEALKKVEKLIKRLAS